MSRASRESETGRWMPRDYEHGTPGRVSVINSDTDVQPRASDVPRGERTIASCAEESWMKFLPHLGPIGAVKAVRRNAQFPFLGLLINLRDGWNFMCTYDIGALFTEGKTTQR